MYFRVSIDEKLYPKQLREIKDPPKDLYYKGKWSSSIFENCLAVVGSRRMTTYGQMVTERLVYEVASRGITIVSGFMYGVDATAHEAALSAKGRTIAVMPCGIDTINPPHQERLYNQILENKSLILSEYPGKSEPQLWTYPKRNRIVAGLCKAVLVVEAAPKSGSLITAAISKNYNRLVMAVPGPIDSINSQGTLSLLKNGATLVQTYADIMRVFDEGFDLPLFSTYRKFIDNEVLDVLSREPMSIDQLVEYTSRSADKISTEISGLMLSGHVEERSGKYYVS